MAQAIAMSRIKVPCTLWWISVPAMKRASER
jgi:hypothetical protein